MTVAGALEDVTTIGAAELAEVVDVDTVVADGFFGFDTTTAFPFCFLAFDEDCCSIASSSSTSGRHSSHLFRDP